MRRALLLIVLLAACEDHGKSPVRDDARTGGADAPACGGIALVGRVRDFTDARSPGPVTFTTRGGGPAVASETDGTFALCGPSTGYIADVTPPTGMLPGIADIPVFGASTDGIYHVLVFSEGDVTALLAQFGEVLDPALGLLVVHQVLGQLQPSLTGVTGMTLSGQPPTWMPGTVGAFVMFTNVTPGQQRYAPIAGANEILVPIEPGKVTYLMSLIVPD